MAGEKFFGHCIIFAVFTHGKPKEIVMKKKLIKKIVSFVLCIAVISTTVQFPEIKALASDDPDDVNIVSNGSFENGLDGWQIYFNESSSGTAEVTSDYRVAVNMNFFLNWYTAEGDQGPVEWSTNLSQKNIQVESGKTYKLKFTSNCTVKRPIEVQLTGMGNTSVQYLLLDPDDGDKEQELTFTSETTGAADLTFHMGQFTENRYPAYPYTTENFEKHTIYISDVSLVDADKADEYKKVPGIIGVDDHASYKTPVAVSVNYKENPYTLTLEKDGSKINYTEGAVIREDGNYVVTVKDNEDPSICITKRFTIKIDLDFNKEYVVIANKSTGKVAEASGVSEGSSLIQSTYTGSAGQFFLIEDSDESGYKIIRSMSSDFVAEVENASAESGAQLIVREYNGSDSQLWKIDDTVHQGYVKFENKASGMVISVNGASKTEGLPLSQETKTSNEDEGQQSTDGQRWDIIRTIDVKSAVMGKNIEVSTAALWAKNALAAPVKNKLNGAGSITTEFYPYAGAAEYKIYFNGELSITVTAEQIRAAQKNNDYVLINNAKGETAKVYVTEKGTVKIFNSWYSTEISGHKIQIKTDNGADTGEVKFYLTKKGIGWATLHRTENMNIGWYYHWATEPAIGTDERLEFVPMIWGNYGDEWLKDPSNKKYGTVLSFNEPDWSDQSNVPVTIASAEAWINRYNAAKGTNNKRPSTVEEAWQSFMDSGLRIGSPATALAPPFCNGTVTRNEIDGPDNWWYEFMDLMDTKEDWDYDFVAVHCYYGSCDAESFLKVIDDTYEITKKPIWITEFGVADWSYKQWSGSEENRQKVIEFVTEVTEGLDERPYVERYAWFPFDPNDSYGGASGIFDYETGELNALGEVYAALGLPEGYEDVEDEIVEPPSKEETGEETEEPKKETEDQKEQTEELKKQTENQQEQTSRQEQISMPVVKWNVNYKTVPLQLKNGKKINKTTAVQPIGLQKGDSIKSYQSSKTSVAAVKKSSNGRLTIIPKKTGKTKITVITAYGATAAFTLKVQKETVKVSKLTVDNVKNKKLTLKKGKSFTLKTTKKYITALDKVTFTTSDKKIATVSSKGKITAKKKGTAKITVKCQKKKVAITVIVN